MSKLTKKEKNTIVRAAIIVGFVFYIINMVTQRAAGGEVNDIRSFVWSIIVAVSFGVIMYIIIKLGKGNEKN